MPLNKKGKKIKSAMMKEYGAKKGKQVFYASENKGTIKGVKKHKTPNGMMSAREMAAEIGIEIKTKSPKKISTKQSYKKSVVKLNKRYGRK